MVGSLGQFHRLFGRERGNRRDQRSFGGQRFAYVREDCSFFFERKRRAFSQRSERHQTATAVLDHPARVGGHEAVVYTQIVVEASRHCGHYAIPFHAVSYLADFASVVSTVALRGGEPYGR